MLNELKALIALESTGTLSAAAVRLRLTQSAVTKRIQALESELGYRVVEPDGRKLKFTSKGLLLVSKAKPLILEIEGLKDLVKFKEPRNLTLGMADSIASSWGPKLVKIALKRVPGLDLELHVHRSTMVLEQVRAGRYELGLIAGRPQGVDLSWSLLSQEAMVLAGKPSATRASQVILSIEMHSATWKEIGRETLAHKEIQGKKFIYLESFSAALQMAKEGFGRALVPVGLAKTFGFKSEDFFNLTPRIQRHIYLVHRKSTGNLQCVQDLVRVMGKVIPDAILQKILY